MDKIRTLLEQLGGSKELVTQIIESLEQFRTDTKAEIKKEYHTRLEKAKEVCLEEVATYKRELAKKAQIFFESRVEKVESTIAKQVAIKDSAAETKLQSIAALLEGIEVKGEGNNAELQAALKQMKELSEGIKKLEATNKILESKIARAHGIAEKTLERNKVLSNELIESRKAASAPVVAESKGKKAPKNLSEGVKTAATPVTTHKGSEIQIAKQKPAVEAPVSTLDGYEPNSIASAMDN